MGGGISRIYLSQVRDSCGKNLTTVSSIIYVLDNLHLAERANLMPRSKERLVYSSFMSKEGGDVSTFEDAIYSLPCFDLFNDSIR
ncbi:unnamed protein product [Cochlearia groenlandica]